MHRKSSAFSKNLHESRIWGDGLFQFRFFGQRKFKNSSFQFSGADPSITTSANRGQTSPWGFGSFALDSRAS